MRYLGGKSKIRKEVSSFLRLCNIDNRTYFEPFVGGAWILGEMGGNRIASDGNDSLIAMYKSLQNGWIPPDYVSENLYKEVKAKMELDSPLTAFVGFGCSFAGKWFGGYARNSSGNSYAKITKNSLLKQLPLIKNVEFVYGLYNEHKPKNMLIYCDPPYEGTTEYGAMGKFNHEEFWDTIRNWIKNNNIVVISEYNAPEDFVCVKSIESRMGLTTVEDEISTRGIRIEKLFMHNSQVNLVESNSMF
jgi:DNA adenine methylase